LGVALKRRADFFGVDFFEDFLAIENGSFCQVRIVTTDTTGLSDRSIESAKIRLRKSDGRMQRHGAGFSS
jgi:hypothetical protein